jgi:hypothetical protein
MQVVSWQEGALDVTDKPACADPVLTRIVQNVNDKTCANRDGDLLCPECSVAMLTLADRTVGTRMVDWSEREAALVHAQLAIEQAEQVAHLVHGPRVGWAIRAAWKVLHGSNAVAMCPPALGMAEEAAIAGCQARSSSEVNAANAAVLATHAAVVVNASDREPVVSAACGAVVRAFEATGVRLTCGQSDTAHHVVDRFRELTGLGELDPLAASDATPALA